MIVRDDEASGIVDRVFGALIAFVFSLLTFVLAPTYVVAKFWVNASILKYIVAKSLVYKLFHIPFFMWIFFVSLLALAYGAYLGTIRTITMLSHLWGTSGDNKMTTNIWAIFIIGFLVSLALMVYA